MIVLDILHEYGLSLPSDVRSSQCRRTKFELDLAYLDERVDIEPMGAKWHSNQPPTPRRRRAVPCPEAIGWTIVPVLWNEAIHHSVGRGRPRSFRAGLMRCTPINRGTCSGTARPSPELDVDGPAPGDAGVADDVEG